MKMHYFHSFACFFFILAALVYDVYGFGLSYFEQGSVERDSVHLDIEDSLQILTAALTEAKY